MKFIATKQAIEHRCSPPDEFLTQAVEWARSAPDEIFAPRPDLAGEVDIFNTIKPYLGPWQSLLHRKAALMEVLRVLGAMESSFNWHEGKDTSNPNENSEETNSAGVFQNSWDGRHISKELRDLAARVGVTSAHQFRARMMDDHPFAFEWTARLLRHTDQHHGPVRRKHDTDQHKDSIYSRLSKAAVAEWQQLISPPSTS